MSKWLFLGVFSLGFFAYAGMNVFFKETNTLEFCTSCHTMQQNLVEYKETIHYKNHSGVRASCADCHVPKEPLAKIWTKIYAVKDVYHEIIGTIDTPEKFEKHRWDMANRVWDKMRESDSRECRSCHSWDAMMFSDQDKSASKKHQRARTEGKTCIDCHKGIAHEEPDEPSDESSAPVAKEQATVTDKKVEEKAPEVVAAVTATAPTPATKEKKNTLAVVESSDTANIDAPKESAPAQSTEASKATQKQPPLDSLTDTPPGAVAAIASIGATKNSNEESKKPVDAITSNTGTPNTPNTNDAPPESKAVVEDIPKLVDDIPAPAENTPPVSTQSMKSTDATDAGALTDLVNSCNTCHGKDGNSQDAAVPNISNASALYLYDTLIAFKSGDRKGDEYKNSDGEVTDMNKITADLTEEQFTALGEYYAAKSFIAHTQKADMAMAAAGAKTYDKKCEKCHAEGGTDPEDDAGIIAGQPKEYLVKQFAHFDDKSREMPKKMAKKFNKLTAEQKQQIIEFLIKGNSN